MIIEVRPTMLFPNTETESCYNANFIFTGGNVSCHSDKCGDISDRVGIMTALSFQECNKPVLSEILKTNAIDILPCMTYVWVCLIVWLWFQFP